MNSASNGVVSFQMAKSGALNEEMRRKTHGSSSQSEMLVTEARGRSQKNIKVVERRVGASPSQDTRI